MEVDNQTKLINECSNEELKTVIVKTTKIIRKNQFDTRKSESFWKAVQIQLHAIGELKKRDKEAR